MVSIYTEIIFPVPTIIKRNNNDENISAIEAPQIKLIIIIQTTTIVRNKNDYKPMIV